MAEFTELTVIKLKKILIANNLPTNGNKPELCQRLTKHYGATSIGQIELDEILSPETDDIQAQINSLNGKLEQILGVVENIVTRQTENTQVRNQNNTMSHDSAGNVNSATNDAQSLIDLANEPVPVNQTPGIVPTINSVSTIQNSSNYHPMLEVGTIKTSMRDIIAVLPNFDPVKEQMTSQQFIAKIENLMIAYGWSEKAVLYAVQSVLKGHAKTWVDSQDVFETWSQFVTAFMNDFPTLTNIADIHIQMMQSKQTKYENLLDYYYKMLAVGRQGKLDDQSIIRHVINGLNEDSVRRTLNAMQIKTCPEFFKAINGIASTIKTQNSQSYTQFNQRTNNFNFNSEKTNVQKDTKNEKRKDITCFNCNEPGHISINCPKPQRKNRCARCNKTHPKEEACKNNNNNTSVRQTVCNDANFEKSIKLENYVLKALIDTGSQSSLIKKSIGEKLPYKRETCKIRIIGICGGIEYANEKIKTTIIIDNVEIPITLLLVNDKLMSSDVLIGQDMFDNQDIQLIIKNKSINVINIPVEKKINIINSKVNVSMIKCEIEDPSVKSKLMFMLEENSSVFATGLSDLGKTNWEVMKITLSSDEIVCQKPYCIPLPKRHVVNEMIDDMLRNNIITPSKSTYASPIILTKKKDGGDRLCVDYRRLNMLTKKEIFPAPNVEECLQDAQKFKYFTTLDLNSGYYQIVIEPESRKYTAFVTHEGQYEFTRMPFGLKNAPINFLRLMAKLKERVGKSTMIHYMDDIMIGADTIDEMFQKLEIVFEALKEANLTLNISKCEFLKTTVKFLGHELTPEGIKPGVIKTEAIAAYKEPKNVSEVRRFLGLSGFFRKFVPGYALISEPLRRLLQKDYDFKWEEEQNNAFIILKNKLTSEPVLTAYKIDADHEIHTDASANGLAGVLLQNENNELKPIAYFSRSTSPTERNFHSYELETLAVVETLERFKYYVCGKTVTVVTDCSAVKSAMSKKELIPRIARWWLKIQDFDLKLIHRQGQRMEHVDALSRAPVEQPNENDVATLSIYKTSIQEDDWLQSMQLQDDEIKQIIIKLEQKDTKISEEYVLGKGRLFKKSEGKMLWVIPKSLRWRMLHECHDKYGHLGVEKTLERLKTYVWFARMRNFCKSYIKACVECAYNKYKGGQTEGEYHFDPIEPIPFKTVHIDHLGPFPKTTKRNEHVLVMVDAFTKYTIIKPVKNTSTKCVLEILREVAGYFGSPQRIVSDRGTAFTAKNFEDYCQENDIRHILNAVRTPRANGHAERANRTILSMLKTLTVNEKHWDSKINDIQWSINTMKNATTGATPHELLFGYSPRDILKNKILLALSEEVYADENEMNKRREQAADCVNLKRKIAKTRFDKSHATPTIYQEGDLILVENEPAATGTSRKLEPRYKGPFIITRSLGNDRYVVEDLPNSSRTSRHYSSVYASDKIKRWCRLPDEFNDISSDADADEL